MAAISSLGLGSGTLTADVIDKLKAADEDAIIKPIEKSVTKVTTKQTDLAALTGMLSSLKSSAYDLGTDGAYLKRTASSSSTAVKVSASDGAQIQDATMTVTQLAKNDIVQSAGFSASTSIVSLTTGTLTIKVGTDSTYAIKTTVGMTLDQLVQSINDNTKGDVKASVLNTGDSTNPYKMILKTKDSGEDNRLFISEDSISTSLGLSTPNIQASSNTATTADSFAEGSIVINGVSIGAFSTSSVDAETNALSIATAINLKASSTGVQAITDGLGKLKLISDGSGIELTLSSDAKTATGFSSTSMFASNEVYSGANTTQSTTAKIISSGDITINGISIDEITLSSTVASENAQTIVDAINLKNSDTGVTASLDLDGKIVLESDDGITPISLTQINGASTKTGLIDDNTSTTINASSDSDTTTPITIADGDIKINGTSIGALSLTSTSSETNSQTIAAAINTIRATTGVYAATDGAGKLKLYAEDGDDISIVTINSAATKLGLASADGTFTGTKSEKLQNAQDSILTYDGISMTRSSNTITDLVSGVTFSLVKTTADANDGNAEISIKQDTSEFSTYAESFVKAFNEVGTKLKELTKYDPNTGASGTFSGIGEITSIYTTMSAILTKTGEDGNSIMDYGFSLDKTGQLSVDTAALQKKIDEDSEALEKLFRGTSVVTEANYTANNQATTISGATAPLGAIIINGVNISAVTTSSTDAETNAQLFASAINSAYSETGVKAYTDGSGKLKLTNDIGGKIQITTTALAASLSGLSSVSGSTSAMSNNIVAYGKIESKTGIFADFNDMLKKLYSNSNSTLTRYDQSLSDELNNLNDEQAKAQARLESRYELLTTRFAMYDKIIAQYQQQFSTLQMQITQAMNG